MYDYVQKSMPERVNRRQNKASINNKKFHDVRYQRKVVSIQKKEIIQRMEEEDFKNPENSRTIEITDRINLEKQKGSVEVVSRYDILKSGTFDEGKQSHISELKSGVNGNYMQLGWDNCVLLQRGEENKYRLSNVWEMVIDEETGKHTPVDTNIYVNNESRQPTGQVVDSLVTWGVSSCEVIILVSNDKMYIAAMHINNDMDLPFSVLKKIEWETAFISLIDDQKEIQRTQALLNELNPTNIKILNRNALMDSGANGHNYIGVNLSEEAGPQLFGSQGQLQAGIMIENMITNIMKCSTWEKAKIYLSTYKSLVEYLNVFLLSIDKGRIIQENFIKMKKTKDFREIFENIIRGTIIEIPFLLEL